MDHDPLASRLAELRAETPGTANVAHLNNAGSALPPSTVTDAVVEHLRLEAMIGGYEAQELAEARVGAARDSLGRLVGAPGGSIALAESATAAWGRALAALVHSGQLRRGDEVLVATNEYASNVLPLLQLQPAIGITVRFVPDGTDGALDVAALADLLSPRTALLALTHAPTHNGLVNDLGGAGRALRESGSRAWYLVDACQSVGQLPVDVGDLRCDFLSATGRKFLRGPRGTGFLHVGDRAMAELEPFPLDLNSAEWVATGLEGEAYELAPEACQRFEPWEKSYAGALGLGAAADYALGLGIESIEARIGAVAGALRSGLAAIPGVEVLDRGSRRGGIVTFRRDGVDPTAIAAALRSHRVSCSVTRASYALRDLAPRGVASAVRLSPHVYTSDDEVERALDVVAATG